MGKRFFQRLRIHHVLDVAMQHGVFGDNEYRFPHYPFPQLVC
jgi:hypothetical protein